MVDRLIETRQEFESRYGQDKQDVSFGETHVALPCDCEDGGGPTHWAAVKNDPRAIDAHYDLYQPDSPFCHECDAGSEGEGVFRLSRGFPYAAPCETCHQRSLYTMRRIGREVARRMNELFLKALKGER